VEGIDGLAIPDRECHVHAAVGLAIALCDPKEGEIVAATTR
jgi:hypothetical protein